MAPTPLDPTMAERLLQGRVAPEDLPPELDRVAAVLDAARRSATERDFSRLEGTVAAMSAAVPLGEGVQTDRAPARSRSLRTKLAAGSVAGLLSMFGGLAAAGALPSAAQDGVATAVSHVGIDLPRGHGHGHGHGDNGNEAVTPSGNDKGKSGEHRQAGNDAGGNAGNSQSDDNHGACVSSVAQNQDHTTSGSQVAEVAQSDCGKPPQANGPDAGNANKPVTPKPDDAPQADHHGKPDTVPSTVPAQSHAANPNSHGNGH